MQIKHKFNLKFKENKENSILSCVQYDMGGDVRGTLSLPTKSPSVLYIYNLK